MVTKHPPACLPSGNSGMPKLPANMIRKQGMSDEAWVGCPGILFFGESSVKPLLLHQYFKIMEDERTNAMKANPLYPIPIVGASDLSHLGVYKSMVSPNEKVIEEFYNEFAVAVQIVQRHCSDATCDKLTLNEELQSAIMRNDIVHYLFELKLACIRGGDTGASKLKDYEDRLLKPIFYHTGMAYLYGGGETAFSRYAAAFKQGMQSCRACGTVRTDAEFIKGFVSGLHKQFDNDKRDIITAKTIDSAIALALERCRNGVELAMHGWEESLAINVGSKRNLPENNDKPTATSVNHNPSSSTPTIRSASFSRAFTGNRSVHRGQPGVFSSTGGASGGGLYRGNATSFESNAPAAAQVFAIHMNDGSEPVEVCFDAEDLNLVSDEMLRAAEESGASQAFRIFQTSMSGMNKICHEWSVKGECSKRTHKYNGEFFLPCHYDHPEIGPHFQPQTSKVAIAKK